MTQEPQPSAKPESTPGCFKIGCGFALLLTLLFPVSCAFGPDWSLPILLWNLPKDGPGGPQDCGYENSGYDPAYAAMTPFRVRLMKRFPPGTDQQVAISSLQRMGFFLYDKSSANEQPCDEGIRVMSYEQKGIGPYTNPLSANVYWKPDRDGKIIWIKGSIYRPNIVLL